MTNLDEADLLHARQLSNLWKQSIDAEVIAHWSFEKILIKMEQ